MAKRYFNIMGDYESQQAAWIIVYCFFIQHSVSDIPTDFSNVSKHSNMTKAII